ncbi:MAG: DUF3187 family protein [Pseudomonadota bacterium]
MPKNPCQSLDEEATSGSISPTGIGGHSLVQGFMKGITVALTLLALLRAASALGQPVALDDPLASRNLSPVYQALGIPPLESATALGAQKWQTRLAMNIASHAVRESVPGQTLEFDGETVRSDFSFDVGLSNTISLSLNIPLLHHSGGELDSLIDDWHALFGLPDGPRATQPRDELLFTVGEADVTSLTDSTSGLGDIELSLSAQIIASESIDASLLLHHKFATGEELDYLGSGAASTAAGARLSAKNCVLESLSCHGQLGVLRTDADPLGLPADTITPYTSVGIAWRLASTVTLLAQMDYHGEVFRSRLLTENGSPLWGSLGVRWRAGKSWYLDASFAEDLAVGASPDINFRFSFTYRPVFDPSKK